ncbi:hypothetical protein [Clostridium tarantellae]|uniref:2'-5' RNA ligase n=1 Tax=Clostridium tarantellae TaxID=39493 RepID=A0A6I1MKB7_9CLOT|nr:hypothetical protein [Clostridium tarantellae]MPQ43404.1 hypothetical protein [Clostridium tarantellae]
MKYYIVALFDLDSYKNIEPVQRNLLRRYKLPKNQLTLHIPLETVDNPNLEKLDEIILKMIKPYKKFKVELTGNISYGESFNRFVKLNIENKGYIKKIHRSLNDMLKLHGFNIKETVDSPLFIPICHINNNFKDPKKNCLTPTTIPVKPTLRRNSLKICKIELWKLSNNRRETIVKSYELKNY